MTKVGFIGLGNMGGPMAANLVKAGIEVAGFDLSSDCLAKAVGVGVKECTSASEVCAGADVVITMLPGGAQTLSVYNEILGAAAAGAVFVDCSTIDVKSAREAHDLAQKAGMGSLDAPVSGGVGGAETGMLTFMVGGQSETFEKVNPLFEIMGARAVLCGDAGSGQAAKICNNMLLAVSMIGACEAFGLADKLGLDRQALFDVISTSSGQCWSVNTYCPVPGVGPHSPADNDYKAGFMASLMLKDLLLGQKAADESGASTPISAYATELYSKFVELGEAETDFSGILLRLSDISARHHF